MKLYSKSNILEASTIPVTATANSPPQPLTPVVRFQLFSNIRDFGGFSLVVAQLVFFVVFIDHSNNPSSEGLCRFWLPEHTSVVQNRLLSPARHHGSVQRLFRLVSRSGLCPVLRNRNPV